MLHQVFFFNHSYCTPVSKDRHYYTMYTYFNIVTISTKTSDTFIETLLLLCVTEHQLYWCNIFDLTYSAMSNNNINKEHFFTVHALTYVHTLIHRHVHISPSLSLSPTQRQTPSYAPWCHTILTCTCLNLC